MARITAEARQLVRKGLLETAAEHFARHGLERANINTIALEAGWAKGTVYNYFSSKEELFGAVLTEACRRTVQRYSALQRGQSVRDHLRALIAADVSVLRDEEAFMKVLVREAMSFRPETYPVILEHLSPFMQVLHDILARGVETKEIRADRPVAELALLFVGVLALLYVQHWGSGGAWPTLDELPDIALTAFVEGAAHQASRHPPR
jgi:AcrR family transcriptional regulator